MSRRNQQIELRDLVPPFNENSFDWSLIARWSGVHSRLFCWLGSQPENYLQEIVTTRAEPVGQRHFDCGWGDSNSPLPPSPGVPPPLDTNWWHQRKLHWRQGRPPQGPDAEQQRHTEGAQHDTQEMCHCAPGARVAQITSILGMFRFFLKALRPLFTRPSACEGNTCPPCHVVSPSLTVGPDSR